METTQERRFLTVRELADLLRISRRRTYELVAAGDVPSVRVGGSIRIPREELDRLLDERTTKPAA
jgi:putative molybdopterin biosynthesis protein